MVRELGNIRADSDQIALIERGAPTHRWAKARVESVSFGSGSPAVRPGLVIGTGVFLIVLGFVPLLALYAWFLYGGVFRVYTIAWCAWSFLGVWLIRDTLRTVTYMQVNGGGPARRLVVEQSIPIDQV